VILFFFEGNKTQNSTRNELDKLVIVGGSNNAGAWGWIPHRWGDS